MRPCKKRRVAGFPACSWYVPLGRACRDCQTITIPLDAFEAMRLVDGTGLSQEEAARLMEVSPPTLCRILNQARRQVAQALCSGWGIRFAGGEYKMDEDCPRRGSGRTRCRRRGAAQQPGKESLRFSGTGKEDV